MYITSLSTDFDLQTVELVLVVYHSSPSLDFHFQNKNVYCHNYDLCPQIFIYSRQRNMCRCTAGLSPNDYLKQAKNMYWFYVYGSVHHNILYEITNRCSYMYSILFHC